MRRALFWCSLLMIFSVPIENSLAMPNTPTISRGLGLLVAALWVATVVASGRIRRPHLFHVAVLLFVLWNGTSILWSIDVDRSLKRTLTWVQLFGLVFILWDVFTTRAAVRAGLQAYVLGACLGLGSLFHNYLAGITESFHRYTATGFGAGDFGAILAIGIPLACYLAAEKAGSRAGGVLRLVNYAYLPAALLGIALSGTRTAAIAIAPGVVFGLWSLTRLSIRARVFIFLILVAAVSAVQSLVPPESWQRIASAGPAISRGDLGGRATIWREAFLVISSRPILGVGTGAFSRAPTPMSPRSKRTGMGKVVHNSYLSILAETGAIGLLGFGAVLWIVAQQALVQSRWDSRFWISTLVTWAILASTLSYEHQKNTWLLLAMTVTSASARKVHGADAGPSPPEAEGIRLPTGGNDKTDLSTSHGVA